MDIVGALIVELRLDPKGFDTAQRRATDALRDLDKNASGIQKTLNNLSKGSQQSGASVVAGASAGAAGFKSLAVAGIEAFAAFKALEGIIGKVTVAADRGALVSRAAWAIGLPGGTHNLDSLIQSIYETAHVSQSTSLAVFDAYQQRIEENKRTGAWAEQFTQAQMLGIHTNAPMDQQIKEIRAALQGKQGPETENWLNAVGFGPLLHWLKLTQAQADTAQQRASQHSLTGDQGKELERLQTAAARYEDSMVHLWEMLAVKFSKSGLSQTLEGFSALIDDMSHNETAMKGLEVVTGAVAVVAGVTLVSGLGRLVYALNAVWATPLLSMLVSGGFWRIFGPIGAFFATMMPWNKTPSDENTLPGADPRVGAEIRQGLRSGGSSSGGTTAGGDPRGREAGLRAAAVANGLNPNDVVAWAHAEGLHAKDYATWDVNNWSYGALQMHKGGLADEYQKETGKDPANPENEDHMNAWAVAYAAKHGFGKWTSVTGGRVSAPRRTTAGVQINSQGMPYAPQTAADTARVAQTMAVIRSAQSSGKSWYKNYDIDHHIDKIEVHTQATDAAGIGSAISGAVKAAINKGHSLPGGGWEAPIPAATQ